MHGPFIHCIYVKPSASSINYFTTISFEIKFVHVLDTIVPIKIKIKIVPIGTILTPHYSHYQEPMKGTSCLYELITDHVKYACIYM